MKRLLVITAAIEAGTGIGLLIAPAALTQLLLGAPLDGPVALTIARVGGAGLLTVGVACRLARDDGRALVVAMLFYNVAAVAILAHATVGLALSGIGLWPAIGLHTALAGWCAVALKGHPRSSTNYQPMKRTHRLRILALAFGLAITASAGAQTPAPSGAKKPNIVVIFGDDVGIWNISAYHRGMMGGSTPNIDRLAKRGRVVH